MNLINGLKKHHSLARFYKDLFIILKWLQVILLGISILTFTVPTYYYTDILSNFKVQYAIISFTLLVIFLLKQDWILICLSVFTGLLNIAEPAAYFRQPEKVANTDLKIYLLNVYTANPQKEETIKVIRHENPDLIILLEINQEWESKLSAIATDYKYNLSIPREDNFGIVLYSKYPITEQSHISLEPADMPAINAKIDFKGKSIRLLAAHTIPPVGEKYFSMRNKQLAEIAKILTEANEDYVILAGDLNTSPWSYYFKLLTKTLQLSDSRKGFGYQPSWPSYKLPLQIPLDHILINKNILTGAFRTQYFPGSDHKGLMAELKLIENPQNPKTQ